MMDKKAIFTKLPGQVSANRRQRAELSAKPPSITRNVRFLRANRALPLLKHLEKNFLDRSFIVMLEARMWP